MRILIADDEDTSRLVLKKLLETLGHEAVECRDGEEVLALADQGRLPQILFMDWLMPGIDGLEVCRRLRARDEVPHIHIVLTTAKTEREDLLAGLRAGADDYLTKPVSLTELETRLGVAIEVAEQSSASARERVGKIDSSKLNALEAMAAGIAHEINNPLAIILSHVSRFGLSNKPGEANVGEQARSIGVISEGVSRIAGIVKALRTFAEGQEGALTNVSVSAVVHEVLGFCEARIRSLGIELRVQELPGSVAFRANKNQVTRILLNLVENSITAVKERPGAWIGFETLSRPEGVELAVSDSGGGVPTEIRGKIFQPFFTTRPVGKGSGLGLSVAKGLAEGQGGSLRLDESAPYTRFALLVPHAQQGG